MSHLIHRGILNLNTLAETMVRLGIRTGHYVIVAMAEEGAKAALALAIGWLPAGLSVHSGKIAAPVITHIFSEKDRKSTRLNSSHANISYAVFCLKKKKT